MWKDEKAPALWPHGPDHPGGGVRPAVSAAHGPDHYQLLYDPERNHGQLRPGLRHGQAGYQLYCRYHQPEIYPRQGELFPVYYRPVPEPGLSLEVLEFGDPGGAHRDFAADYCLGGGLRLHPLARQGQRRDFLFLRHSDADALPGDSGAQLLGQRLAGHPQYPLGHYPARRLRALLGVFAHQVYAAHPQFPDRGRQAGRLQRVPDF